MLLNLPQEAVVEKKSFFSVIFISLYSVYSEILQSVKETVKIVKKIRVNAYNSIVFDFINSRCTINVSSSFPSRPLKLFMLSVTSQLLGSH